MSQQEQRTLTDADFEKYGRMWRENGSQATTERAETATAAPRRPEYTEDRPARQPDQSQTKNFSENRGTNNPPRPKGTGQPPPQQQAKGFSPFGKGNWPQPKGAAQGKTAKDNAALLKAMGATSMKAEVVYAGIVTWLAVLGFIGLLWWFSAIGTRLLIEDNMALHCTVSVFKGVKSSSCPSLNTAVFDVGVLQWFDWAKMIFVIQAVITVMEFRLLPHFEDEEEFSFEGFLLIMRQWVIKTPGHAVFWFILICADAGTTLRNLQKMVDGWHLAFLKFEVVLGPSLPFYNWLLLAIAVLIATFSFMAFVYALHNLKEDFSYL